MTAVARGLQFEQLTVRVLARFGMNLQHSGRAGDGGVDVRGVWRLSPTLVLPVVGQCKNHKVASGPVHVRELEGALGAESSSSTRTIGILVTANGFSPKAHEQLRWTNKPLIFCHIDGHGDVDTFLLSAPARALVPGLIVYSNYTPANGVLVPHLTVSLQYQDPGSKLLQPISAF